ncbi:beta-1,6-N-acetylglucosaminyltransferase [Humisphaera borealis]|uniref:Glycosyl transferase n=1 Tax=Humisphaera borealis TaxID=2807512 RepID=A0A7M2X4M3_9BACT|nr:beta-1,6-N-acetylglucosaminyltransferase [Humisphaera borealis]QOV91720.1 hypothetical protein IPV69_10310 [Humisphaera borealis]
MSQRRIARPRVVYFVASHVNPEQIVRLVRACRSGSPESRVLLHHDYAVSNLDPALLKDIGNVDLLPAESAVGWGGFANCALAIRCLKWLVENRDFDWVVHLSGQCYPVRPLGEIERELATCGHDGWVRCDRVEDLPWEVGPMRYLYQYYELPKFTGWSRLRSLIDAHARRRLDAGKMPWAWVSREKAFRVGIRSHRGPLGKGLGVYKGSTWWTINRRSVEYLLSTLEARPDVARYYRRTQFASNESMFQTLLCNVPHLNFVRDNEKRFIRWSHAETGHPDILGVEHFEKMVASDAFFARKIDARSDGQILDLLDRHIGLAPAAARAA